MRTKSSHRYKVLIAIVPKPCKIFNFTISLAFFLKAIKIVLAICNWRLLCALYVIIDFYALQGFFDLKLLFQGTCSLFQRHSEGKYETFSWELRPRIPHHYNFCISKNGVPLIDHGYATAYIFHKKAFKLTMSRECLMV